MSPTSNGPSASFPTEDFEVPHEFVLELLRSQGIHFDAVLICPHRPDEGCDCRKPRTRLVDEYLAGVSFDRARSAVIGDRDTDLELARRLGIIADGEKPERSRPKLVKSDLH